VTNRNRTGGGVSRRCSVAARPSGIRHFETPSCVSGIRHGRAARTGWNDNPRRWKRSSDASHCRRSRIGNSCDRRKWSINVRIDALVVDQVRVPLRMLPASKHHNARECVRQRVPGLGVGIGTGCFGTKRKRGEKPCRNACRGANARCSISGSVGENETPPEGIRGPRRSGHRSPGRVISPL
jgi:hypothetical protein